jgi:thiamine transport system ATP-binding protein
MLIVSELAVEMAGFSARYDLAVPRGALCAVVGPSGGGKTTLLHAIAGFVRPVSGTLTFDGRDLLPLTPAERPLTLVFQEHNLFPHLTAADNVGLGIHAGLRLTAADRARVEAGLSRVGLAGLGARRPHQLSGGQRQRVALARALVRDRPLLLLDEPFSALDQELRREMIGLVDDVRRERGLTVVMSIHTPEDAAGVADLVAEVRDGRVTAVAAAPGAG